LGFTARVRLVLCSVFEIACSVLDGTVIDVSRANAVSGARLVSGRVKSGAGALELVVLTRCSR
jgi:hypothetical protein